MENKFYIDLSNKFSVLKINGSDAHKFLQGLITNDINKADKDPSKAIYAFILTPQGKYLFDVFIYKNNDEYLLIVKTEQAESLIKKLMIYKLKSDVKIEKTNFKFLFFNDVNNFTENNLIKFEDPRKSDIGGYLLVDDKQNFVNNITEKFLPDYSEILIDNVIVFEGFEAEKSYPLQFRAIENNAVDFNKGCYVGQEVTARMFHRGTIRKTIVKIDSKNYKKNDEIFDPEHPEISIGQVLEVVRDKCLVLAEKELVS